MHTKSVPVWVVALLLLPFGLRGQEAPDIYRVGPEVFAAWRHADELAQPLWSKAEAAVRAGNYAEAAETFASLSVQLPPSPQSQQAAFRAGLCFAETGNHVRAIDLFDDVIKVGVGLTTDDFIKNPKKHSKREQLGKRLISIREWTQKALYEKAMLCLHVDLRDQATMAIEHLATEFPNYDALPELATARAQLRVGTGQEPLVTAASEQQAQLVWAELDAASKERGHDQVMLLADRLAAEHPDSVYGTAALARKAESLWSTAQYDKARETYRSVLTRGRAVAPEGQVVRTAEHRIAWLDGSKSARELIARQRNSSAVPEPVTVHAFRDDFFAARA